MTAPDDLDEIIGERVHQALWRSRVQQATLADALGLDQAAVSRRLRGRTAWKVSDLVTAAEVLGVPVASLIPEPDAPAAAAAGGTTDIGCSRYTGRRLRLVPGSLTDFRYRMPLKLGVSAEYSACPA